LVVNLRKKEKTKNQKRMMEWKGGKNIESLGVGTR
jgi:hypothetical protein